MNGYKKDGFSSFFPDDWSPQQVVDAIAAVEVDMNDRPLKEQKMASIRVDTQGVEYPEPKKLRDPYGR